MKNKIKALAIIALAAVIGRHGCRCLSALAGVFAKQKLLCILIAGMLLVCTSCPTDTTIAGGGGGTVISIAAVSGVTVPEQGASPVTAIDANAQYTGTVAWNGAPAAFDYAAVYTATITLTPKSGYTLNGVPADFFTVEGAASVSNAANSGVITAVFPQTADDPTLLHLSGDISISPDTSVAVRPDPGVTVGMELIAAYSGGETVSYQWKKDGADVGTDSDTYTPTETGNYTVTVSAAGYNPKTSDPVAVGPRVVPEVAVLNVSKSSEWDWLVVGADGSSMVFNADKTTGIPTRLFVKPDKDSDTGITYTFKENGLPDVMVNNGTILVFDNFDEYTFDVAIIFPDGTTEYHYGIETDVNWDVYNAPSASWRSVLSGARSALDDDEEELDTLGKLSISLDIFGHGLGVITCATALTNPASAVGCYIYLGSVMVKLTVTCLEDLGVFDDWVAGSSNLTVDGINLVIDSLGCAGKGVQDCVSAVCGLTSMLIGDDLQTVAGKIAELYEAKEDMKSGLGYVAKVNFHANGGGGTVPAPFTVPKTEVHIPLPSGGGLYRDGYTFIGWNTSPRFTENTYKDAYFNGGKVKNTSFYATWKQILDGTVTGVSAAAASSSRIRVSWDPVPDASEYRIYRGMSALGAFTRVATPSSSSTVYWDDELSANTTYYYKVSYYKPGGESPSVSVYARTMATNVGTPVTFTEMTANGYSFADGSVLVATTELTLTFSAPIYGLTADDITLFGMEGVQKGTLRGSGPSYTLGVSGFTRAGAVYAAVLKSGYNINGTQLAFINYLPTQDRPGLGPPELVYVQGGTFQLGKALGTASSNNDKTPVSNVTLTDFYIGKYEVTQAQWYAVMGMTVLDLQANRVGNYGWGAAVPIYYVNWYDTLAFCNKLSVTEGFTPAYRIAGSTNPDNWGDVPIKEEDSSAAWDAVEIVDGSTGYRLPSEAQREYAAKGGNPLAPGWVGYAYAGSDTINDVAWYGSTTHKGVGTKDPNFLGLYDMSGNVGEWCWDRYVDYTSEDKTNPTGPSSGWSGTNYRVMRDYGTGSFSSADRVLCVFRHTTGGAGYGTLSRMDQIGFRLARPGLVGAITAPPVWREGTEVLLTAPQILTAPGQTVSTQGWQTSSNGTSGWSNFTEATAEMSHNGAYLRYYAASGGTTYYSNTVPITRVISAMARGVTIDMLDSYGDGWNGNGALRINVNGVDIAAGVKVETNAINNIPSGQRNSNTYTFYVEPGDVVQLYWVGGSTMAHNSFVVYYADTPPDPEFTYSGWNGNNALVFRLWQTMNNTADGALLGEFTNTVVYDIAAPVWHEGTALSLTAPYIFVAPGSTATAQGWQISSNGTDGWTNFTPPATAAMSHNGKYLWYYATISNTTGSTTYYSNTVPITVIPANGKHVTIDMFDSRGDGWDGNGALRITLNGVELTAGIKVATTADNNFPSGQRSTNTASLLINAGDVVQFYWVAGSAQSENSFIVYYTDLPPNPAFTADNNTNWDGSNALVFRLRGSGSNSLNGVTGGALLGEFTAP